MNQRLTPAKKATIKYINSVTTPFSAQDLIDHLNGQGLVVNKTTVYRQIDGLLAEGILQEVNLNEGVMRYEPKQEHCHHHIVCTKCGKIAHVELGNTIIELQKALTKKSGYRIEKHMLEFFGKCNDCK